MTASVTGVSDHAEHGLAGTSPNFVSGKSIELGSVRYIRPTVAHPEIRLRFTPADGQIYASTSIEQNEKALRDWEQANITAGQRVYDSTTGQGKGSWYHWSIPVDRDGVEDPWSNGTFLNETLPPSLFAIVPPAPPWLNGNVAVSRGYLDDACDGIVEVSLTLSDRTLTAASRISAGPRRSCPTHSSYAAWPTISNRPSRARVAAAEPPAVTHARAEEIVRRAFETVRFMNVAVMNGEPVQGRPPLSLDTMPAEEAFDTDRADAAGDGRGTVDTLSVMVLHQQVFAALRGGAAPWFVRLLRSPAASGDFTDDGRRRMPALDVRRRWQLPRLDPPADRHDRTRRDERTALGAGGADPAAAVDHTAQPHRADATRAGRQPVQFAARRRRSRTAAPGSRSTSAPSGGGS